MKIRYLMDGKIPVLLDTADIEFAKILIWDEIPRMEIIRLLKNIGLSNEKAVCTHDFAQETLEKK